MDWNILTEEVGNIVFYVSSHRHSISQHFKITCGFSNELHHKMNIDILEKK